MPFNQVTQQPLLPLKPEDGRRKGLDRSRGWTAASWHERGRLFRRVGMGRWIWDLGATSVVVTSGCGFDTTERNDWSGAPVPTPGLVSKSGAAGVISSPGTSAIRRHQPPGT